MAGSGALNITDGGVFNQNIYTSPDAVIAVDTASTGDVIVHGDGSEWSMAILTVGSQGDATLSIEEGGLVQSNGSNVVLGDEGGSGRIAVFGSGTDNSTLDVANSLYVGYYGLGVLHVGQDLAGAANGAGALTVGSSLLIGETAGNIFDNKFVIDGDDATANIGGGLQTGVNGKGIFEARGGADVDVGGAVWAGVNSDASGTIHVDGGGTTLDAKELIAGNGVGNGSTGAVTVSGGAVVTLTGADSTSVAAVTLGDDGSGEGTLTVTGAGSIVQTTNTTGGWFIGGSGNETGGTGTVNILDGGQGISAFRVVIGYGTGADGTLNIDGTDSLFDASGTYVLVGNEGLGEAEVTNGGRIDANAIYVATAASTVGSQMRINGTDSTVDIDGFLRVGERSRGTVEVSGGAQLNVASGGGTDVLYIGTNGTADGSQLTVTGPGSRVDYFGTALVAVGVNGGSIAEPARLVVSDGGVFSAQAPIRIGYAAGSYGQIEISGEDSLVEAERIYVGDGNAGSSGILDLAEGGTATTTGELYVASAAGNVAVDVSDPTSSLNVGSNLFLGWGTTGEGILAVGQGGAVSNGGQAYIGWTSGSQATATVASFTEDTSTWTIGGELTLAGTETTAMTSGFGRLYVNSGGLVDVASNLRIRNLGYAYLYGGELRVGGDLLFPDTGSLFYFNSGTLRFTDLAGTTLDAALLGRIFDGGPHTLSGGKALAVDGTAQLTGELRLNGGTFRAGNISTDDFANVDFDAGTFELTDSNLVVDVGGLFGASLVLDGDETVNVVGHDTTIAVGASLNVIGGGFTNASAINDGLVLVSQTDAVDFDSDDSGTGLTNNGQLVLIDATVGGPVTGSGAIEIVSAAGVGGLTLASGASLGIDIWGTGVGEFDTLTVAGAASLAGELMVDLATGYTPAVGDTFEVLTAASLVDNGMLLTGDATGFSLVSTSTSLLLAFLPGDYNNDGTVNVADYTVWRDTLGATGVGLPADGDGSGTVDAIDYGIWKTNFGISAGAVFAALEYAAVPEPATVVPLAIALCGLTAVRRGAFVNRAIRILVCKANRR